MRWFALNCPGLLDFLYPGSERHTNKVIFAHQRPNNNPERGPLPPISDLHLEVGFPPLSTRPQRRDPLKQAALHLCSGPFRRVSRLPSHDAETTLLFDHLVQLDLQRQHAILAAKRLPSAERSTYTPRHGLPERAGNGPWIDVRLSREIHSYWPEWDWKELSPAPLY